MNTWKRVAFTCLSLLVVGLAPMGAAVAQVKVTAANPSSASQGTIALDVVVSGSGFNSSAKVEYFVTGTTNPGGITVRNVRFNSSRELVTTIDVAEDAYLASFDIVVTLSSGRKGKGTTLFSVTSKSGNPDSYVGQNLGTLPGDRYSDAWDVNAAGNVVGRSYSGKSKAIYWAGTMFRLPLSAAAQAYTSPYAVSWDAEAQGISNGPVEIAVGWEQVQVCESQSGPCTFDSYPVYWSGDLTQSPAAVRLDGIHCQATEINAAGSMAVGICPGQAGAIWSRGSNWARTNIPMGAFVCDGCEYTNGVAWDVNDAGIVIGSLNRSDNYLQFAYIYSTQTATGTVLPIPPGFVQIGAYAVSNVRDGVVHVAGVAVTCNDYGSCVGDRAIRWTVDVNSLQVSFEILDQLAWAEGVTDEGFVAGTHNSEPSRRGTVSQTATMWKELSGYVALKPPTGSDSTTRGMAAASDGSVFVVGVSKSKSAWTASRWVIP